MRYQVYAVTESGNEKAVGKITLLASEQTPDIVIRKLIHQKMISGAPSDYYVEKSGSEGESWEIRRIETDELIGLVTLIG